MKKALLTTILLCAVAVTATSQVRIPIEKADSTKVDYYCEHFFVDFLILPNGTHMNGVVIGDNEWEEQLDDTTDAQFRRLMKAAYFDKSPIVRTVGDGYTDGEVVRVKVYSNGNLVYEKNITSETEYIFTPEFENLSKWMYSLLKHYQLQHTRFPQEIVMLSEDLDLQTAVRVTPEIFDQWELDTVRLKVPIETYQLIRKMDTDTMEYKPCDNCGIDVRGKLILKFYDRQETIYYNSSILYRNGKYYKIQSDFPRWLERVRNGRIKQNKH